MEPTKAGAQGLDIVIVELGYVELGYVERGSSAGSSGTGAPSTREVGKRWRSVALEETAGAAALPRADQEIPGADYVTVYTKQHEDALSRL